MSKPSFIQRFGKKLAKRGDAWVCHYCEKPLIPLNAYEHDTRYYKPTGIIAVIYGHLQEVWDMRPEFGYPTIDHIIIRKDGGTDDLDNLVLACGRCNTERNTMPYANFKALVESRPKGYPHCSMCGTWYATTNYRGGMICDTCAGRLS